MRAFPDSLPSEPFTSRNPLAHTIVAARRVNPARAHAASQVPFRRTNIAIMSSWNTGTRIVPLPLNQVHHSAPRLRL
jgi:hypothetical protein